MLILISEHHESSIIYTLRIFKVPFKYLWMYLIIIVRILLQLYFHIDISASLPDSRQLLYKFVPIGTYVVDFREGIIIGNFLWRICAQYPIPFSLVLFLFSNPNERTCLVCIAISIYWLSSVRFATYSIAVFFRI